MTDEEKLISKYIDTTKGVLMARIKPEWVNVWAIIGYLKAVDWDEAGTAHSYDIPLEAVQAASAFYRKHTEAIDAYLEMQALA